MLESGSVALSFQDMIKGTLATRFRTVALICAVAAGVLLAYLTLSQPPTALTQETGITIADAQAVSEGDSVQFLVTLNATTSQAVSLTWSVAGGTATSDDFATTTGAISFPASPVTGATTTVTVQTAEDAVVEPDESFSVTLAGNNLPAGLAISDASADGTITNDDSATISIADASAAEGADVEFVVTLSASVSQAVSLKWVTADGTAASSTDYVATTTGLASFPANSKAGATTTITVDTTEDAVVEPDEDFTVTLTPASTLLSGVSIADAEATGTITNDDSATISIGDDSASEGADLVFDLTLSAPVSQAVSLTWSTVGGTATASTDFVATTSAAVSFPANSTSTRITVQTTADDVVELDEDFTVRLATSTPLLSGLSIADAEATGTITNDDSATISIGDDSASEGDSVDFTVTLSAPVSQAVSLSWATADGAAASSTDYTATTGVVSFSANSTTGTITVQTQEDAVVEPDESFSVTISGSSLPTNVTIADAEATGTITNDDTATITIADASAEEGDSVGFVVTLSASVSEDSSFTWSTADGTAASSTDYTARTSVMVVFPALSGAGATATATVQTAQDDVVEPDEDFTVTLATTTLIAGVSIGGGGMATGTITNDDTATITIANASAVEGSDVEFVVTLSASVSEDSSFAWTTADGTAGAPDDYTAVASRVVTFAANSAAGATTTVTVQTAQDDVVEPDENFTVTLATSTLIAGVSIGGGGMATGTITNDDSASITIADASAEEGNALSFTITLSAPVSQVVSLSWATADGTAASSTDYTATTTATVFFPANSTTATITVQTAEDAVVEPSESLTVTLSSSSLPSNVTISDKSADGTITNDDTATITIADASAAEGDGVGFVVTLSASVSQDSSFTWSTANGTAGALGDYTAVASRVVTFAANSAAGATTTLTVDTTEDAVVEPDEDFTVTLATSTLIAGVTITDAEATGTITNDDTATITIADASAVEGSDVEFVVTLSASVSEDSSFAWSTTDGTAGAPGDYTAMESRVVTFAANSAAGATTTLTVQTTQDVVVEPDESFTVTLATSTLITGVTIADAEATGTITNDDSASITIADASAEEGNALSFTVTLSAPVSQAVNLSWATADGTAASSTDYTATTTATVSFPANSTTTTITVQTTEDVVVEPSESLTVTISGSSLPDSVTISDKSADGTITNDDSATISIGDASASEGDGVDFTVTLSASVSEDSSFAWSTANGTAGAPGDYTAVASRVVTFAANSAAGATTTLTVDTTEDDVVEPDEDFTVTLATSTLIAGVTITDAEATGTITNDDSATIAIADASAVEGTDLVFNLTLSAPVSQVVSLSWVTADGTAASSTDYVATTSGTVSFPANSTTTTITVDTVGDNVVETDESLVVTLSGTPPDNVTITDTSADGTITNDDTAAISIADASASEGSGVSFTITLSASVSQAVNLSWVTVDDTAASSTDYVATTSGMVSFPANSAAGVTKTVTVDTTVDDVVEADEDFVVRLATTTLLLGGVSFARDEATGTITNDDSASITITDASAEEGEDVVFVVALSASVAEDVNLSWSTANGTAVAPDDYAATTSVALKFPAYSDPGATTTITVKTAEEAVVEPVQSFSVTLSAVGALLDGVTIADATGVGSITNDDSAAITIANASAVEGDGVEFVVTLSASVSEDSSFAWSTADGTAVEVEDYTAVSSRVVTFAANSVPGATTTVTVQTAQDAVVEPVESFTVTLATSTLIAGVSISGGMATGTITNDDSATISITDASASEGSGVSFTVTLSAPVSQAVTLSWVTVDGTAASSTDYVATTSGTVLLPARSTTATITVRTVEDAVVEPGENFRVRLATTTSLLAGVSFARDEATGTITNDDSASITITDASAEEGEDVVFVVALSASVAEDVNLSWSTANGTAVAPDDYAATTSVALKFPAYSDPGATTTITVKTAEEAVVEPVQSFSVTLSAVGALLGGVTIADATGVGSITNDDSAQISIGDASAVEGAGVQFVVTLSASVSEDSSFAWSTADGTAVEVEDYTAVSSRVVTFPANSVPGATTTVTVQTAQDEVVEPIESFTVTLATSTLIAGVSIGGGMATGTITNDDTAAVTIANASAVEGEGIEFVVTLSASVSEEVKLTWVTSDGTAVAPVDYVATSSGEALFGPNSAPGATTTITVQTVEDLVVERVESFVVTLTPESTLLSGVSITDASAIGWITNDDTASITIADVSAEEGEGAEFVVRLSASVSEAVSLSWATSDGTATAAGNDYTAVTSGMALFATSSAPGATTTITVQTTEDLVVEQVESFSVTLSGTLLSGVRITDAEAIGTITNDDTASITISDARAGEGQVIEFVVRLNASVSQDVIFMWAIADGTAVAGIDYDPVATGTVEFAANSGPGATRTIAIKSFGDGVVEPTEVFEVTISGATLPQGVSINDAEATGTIVNDDEAPVDVPTPTPTPTPVPVLVARLGSIPGTGPVPNSSNVISADPTPTLIIRAPTPVPVVLLAPTPSPTPIPRPSPTPMPTPVRVIAATATPTPLPTPTPPATRMAAPTPTPTPTAFPTPTQTPEATPTPATALLVNPSDPRDVTDSEQTQRARSTLDLVAAAGRDRLTLVVILAPILVAAAIAFAYLILRRR